MFSSYLNNSSEMRSEPIAPRCSANSTWSGPYHARSSSEPNVLKNLCLQKKMHTHDDSQNEKCYTHLSNIMVSLENLVSLSCVEIYSNVDFPDGMRQKDKLT